VLLGRSEVEEDDVALGTADDPVHPRRL
jgi:hypothetical protein